ncbi:MAG: hypothetical protein ACHP8A_14895 [Terriglobales bacterium]|jgi:hypothetical protein
MRHHILPLALVLLCGCNRPRTGTLSQSEGRGLFSVNVQLSEAASTKLIDNKETIIVAGTFTGHPRQGTEARYLDIKSGDVDLGDVKQEIRPGEIAIFDQLNLNPDALARIDSQGPNILMDVYSGRRSSKDNLLDCDGYDGGFESIRGRTVVIRCQLIEERFPRAGR